MSELTPLLNALNYLTEQEDYVKVRELVRTTADLPSVAFVGEHAVMNPLLVYARENGGAAALDKLFKITDEAVGITEEPDSNGGKPKRKADYMTPYMRERRDRQYKAARAKWLLLPDHIRAKYPKGLIGQVRKDFIVYLNEFWGAGKTQAVNSVRGSEDRILAGKRYWEEIDALLDRALEGDRLAAKKVLGNYVLPTQK